MTHSPRMRAFVGSVALAAGIATFGGCGDGTSGDKVSVNADHAKVSVDPDKGEVSVKTDDGTATAGQGLPDGFPQDDVPLVDAKVVAGAQGGPGGQFAWSAVVQTARAVDDVTAEVKRDFAAAGYTNGQANEMGDVTILQFTGAKYVVSVTAARTGDNVTLTYLVKNPS